MSSPGTGNINGIFAMLNADFSQAVPVGQSGNILNQNGQLWIGTNSSPNPSGTTIKVGKLVSPKGTVTVGYSAPNITLDVTGSLAYTQTPISYQVLNSDDIIGVSNTASSRTITMPNSGLLTGKVWTIKDESGLAAINNIIISGNGVNIDGASTYIINTDYGAASLYYNGTQFFVI